MINYWTKSAVLVLSHARNTSLWPQQTMTMSHNTQTMTISCNALQGLHELQYSSTSPAATSALRPLLSWGANTSKHITLLKVGDELYKIVHYTQAFSFLFFFSCCWRVKTIIPHYWHRKPRKTHNLWNEEQLISVRKNHVVYTHTHHGFLSEVVLETLWIAVRMIDEIEALVGTSARPTITVTQHPTQFCLELKIFHPLRKIYLLYLDIPIKAETVQTYNPGCCHCHSTEQ